MPENSRVSLLLVVLAWYLVWGVIAFAVYARDKRAAQRSHRRTAEARLRSIELLGGAFGAALAQKVLRHKTSKPGFRALTLLIAAVHGAIVCGLGWWAFAA
ncbi:hypothetical protein AY599_11710 [Leptolyngbya valderiana BDU 20041]|nr:hypothetical protein AY599_11710 [Leptolyngbya valderiana BDU 20041]